MIPRARLALACCLLAGVAVISCNVRAPEEDSPGDDDTDTTTSGGSDTSDTGGGYLEGEPCSASSECAEGLVCVAPWDSGAETPLGEAVCVPDCVDSYDLNRFCLDDEACCEDGECSLDGLCEPDDEPGETDTGDTGSETGTDEGTDTDTGTGTGTGSG